ncbi:ATP-binding protein [Allocoleopsis franciscana]|uniref:histidine kinase n=1 Tax=Allocoleopsis franciscana PCC 7113 TaxID=1173027 RepID=K9WH07_9CYAN|nr:ATP-binding protein [Allocoleopsis franciscana]AFZ19690.1 signal transduction histidine kinase [Allocoleopsis franciscana PCC 7113]
MAISATIITIEIRFEQDVVMTRQRARLIAELLGFDAQDQTRIATAVSEIARNAFQYAQGGRVEFRVEGESPQSLLICICDKGAGIANLNSILEGRYTSATGMGLGIIGSKRLMEWFEIESSSSHGTTVQMGKPLPKRALVVNGPRLAQIADELVQRSPSNPLEEIQQQNQELLRALAELQKREEALTQLNRELEDTNRGVVALYAELDEKADSLKRANELKTRFLSNMSHEFRTPLNSVISLSRMLLDRMDGELTPDQEKQVTFIRKAAEGLSELVNDLLDLAKVEAGKIVVQPDNFEVSELFGTLRGMLRPLLAHNSSIALVFEEPRDIPTLYTDEGKVAQILRNFISNALKFTPTGEVRVSAVRVGNTITFSVADTGIGIAAEDTERIFEEFVQVDSPLQRQVKGTGLGLPLSRKLAELLGGNVWVTGTIGVGSTFFASIPLVYSGSNQESPLPPVSWKLDPQRLPILVVEDNAETLFTYEKYFQGSIYQPFLARTLDEAEQALTLFTPTAIMLDILLEEQHTWGFIAELKGNQATQEIPILVVTVIDNEKQVRALGANAFLVKPVDRWSLLNQINTLIKRNTPQKLLLIDDDPASQYVLKQLLSDTDLNISEAFDGREGIDLAQIEKPDCIILDLSLPEMSGDKVLSLLKSDSKTNDIPVIINTSQSLETEEQKNLAQNTVAILSKETASQEIAIARVREALVKAGIALKACERGYV